MGDTELEYPHALVVPSMGQGHISSCMLLAQSLAALGFKVTFVYFSSHFAQLKANHRLVLPSSSHMAEWREPASQHSTTSGPHGKDSHIDNLARNTTTISNGLIEIRVIEDGFAPGDIDKYFFVTPAMKENLFSLILELQERGSPPTCLVSDTLLTWTLHVTKRAGIPRIDFWTSNAMSYLTLTNVSPLYSEGIFPEKGSSTQWKSETPLMLDHIPGLPPFSSDLYPPFVRFADPSDPLISFLNEVSSCGKCAERILVHTMQDIEANAFHAFQLLGIPAYGIGPLLQYTEKSQEDMPASSQAEAKSGVSQLKGRQTECISWLNTQADSSVIYIAFGSVATLSAEEIQELACGLEASGSPFLWGIREGSLGAAELTQVLPKGFFERTSERGMIMGWAPQVEVLAHKATGGFLTHCGWNSSLESLWEGVPMLCCPRSAEQRWNSDYLCNSWGVGLELERTDTGGLERRFVELGVKALMQEEVGLKTRGKVQEMMQLARKTCQPGGQSFSNLQKFYDDMKALCSKPKSHISSK